MLEQDETLRQRCNRRLASLRQQRQPFEPDWKEIAGYCAPARSRFLSTNANKGRRPNRRLNNGYGILAFRTLQNGMTAGLSSKSRPWFKLSLYDQTLLDDPEVKVWLEDAQNAVEAFLAETNFYEAVEVGYLELGMFGTEACVMLEHDTEGAVCHALTAGEYWVGLNSAMRPGALYRDSGSTVKQAVDTFKDGVSQRVRSLYDQSRYDDLVPMFHVIEENDDQVPGMLGWQGKPWRSMHFEGWDDAIGTLVKTSGYEEQPFWAPRWSTTGADTYGQGPGHDSLPDLRELQLQAKRKAELTDLMAWPELVASSKVKLKRQPKSVVSADMVDASKAVSIPYQVPPQALEAVMQDVERLEQRIGQISFADLFMAITDMQGVQPRNQDEINARIEEKMTQLGPVIERVNGEKLAVALDRTIGIMQRLPGKFPPAPEQIQHSPHIKFEFVSMLTQMQRMAGLSQIERVVQFGGGLSGMYPQARFKLDPLAIMTEYADRAGMPANLTRSDEDANKDSEAEQQAAQNQQMAEMAAKLGKPAKDMTDAATLAANLPVAATPAVQALPQ